jgi:multiple antibiotic resistance protein
MASVYDSRICAFPESARRMRHSALHHAERARRLRAFAEDWRPLLLWNSFLIAFSVLLPLINPLGSALVFLGLVGDAPPQVYRSLARRIAINNVIFLVVIELLGAAFSTSSASRCRSSSSPAASSSRPWAGRSSTSRDAAPTQTSRTGRRKRHLRTMTRPRPGGKSLLSVHVPHYLRAGNAGGRFHRHRPYLQRKSISQKCACAPGVFLAIRGLSVLVYFCYAYAPKITKAIPPNTAHGILRVVAFILLCIGVQIAWNGLSQLLTTLLKP